MELELDMITETTGMKLQEKMLKVQTVTTLRKINWGCFTKILS